MAALAPAADSAGTTATGAPAHLRPDAADGAARQVAVALSASPDGLVEIALDPAELGPVRVGLAAGDGTMTVHVSAERPETLDLFRRHADLLARELREAGYGDVSFRFGSDTSADTSGRDPRGGSAQAYAAAPQADGPAAAPLHVPTRVQPAGRTGGLDLRL